MALGKKVRESRRRFLLEEKNGQSRIFDVFLGIDDDSGRCQDLPRKSGHFLSEKKVN